MLKIAICEDDASTCNRFSRLMLQIEEELDADFDVTVFNNGEDFCKTLGTTEYDIVYLDYYMGIALIIGNALDNAIEACWEVKDRSKIVKLRLCEQMGNLYLHVENPYDGIIRCHNGIPMSTRGIGHGFGFKTIQRIVQEQSDYMSVDLSENIFKLKIIFYNENIENLSLG